MATRIEEARCGDAHWFGKDRARLAVFDPRHIHQRDWQEDTGHCSTLLSLPLAYRDARGLARGALETNTFYLILIWWAGCMIPSPAPAAGGMS